MNIIEFSKYHGVGNDMIILNGINREINLTCEERQRMCARKYGIGADGIIIISYNEDGLLNLDYINANGGFGSLCGNGCRCGLAFARRLGLFRNDSITFKAYDGKHTGRYIPEDDTYGVSIRDIAMGNIRKIDEKNYFVNTGSPHHVRFVDDIISYDVISEGRRLRYGMHGADNGANINFVEISSSYNIQVRTYERGVENETNACGTGAVAVAIVEYFRNIQNTTEVGANKEGNISLDILMGSGKLSVKFEMRNSVFLNIELIGKAVHVFDGKYFLT